MKPCHLGGVPIGVVVAVADTVEEQWMGVGRAVTKNVDHGNAVLELQPPHERNASLHLRLPGEYVARRPTFHEFDADGAVVVSVRMAHHEV